MTYPLVQSVIDSILSQESSPGIVPNQYVICKGICELIDNELAKGIFLDTEFNNVFSEIWENVKHIEDLQTRIEKLLNDLKIQIFRFGIPIVPNDGEAAFIFSLRTKLENESDEPREEESPYVFSRNLFRLLTREIFKPTAPPHLIIDHEKIIYGVAETTKHLSGLTSRCRNALMA